MTPRFNGMGVFVLIWGLMFTIAVIMTVIFTRWYVSKDTTFKLKEPITPTTELIIVDGKVDTLYVYKF